MATKKTSCSFCGLPREEVKILIAGVTGHICENCAKQANQIVAEDFSNTPEKPAGTTNKLDVRFPKEIKAELEPADKIEINGNEASTSEEEEIKPKNVDESPDSNSYVHVSATSTKTLIESEHRVSLNTQANVTYSAEKGKGV